MLFLNLAASHSFFSLPRLPPSPAHPHEDDGDDGEIVGIYIPILTN
ncbi:hypothetical protein EI77_00617 [Prosthecobacter fusiformis]|uniref:Uncharacterized protein n=1 Tax=Prosthecobacter fusiformis TaxID=48464 RepID=A0A4V3FI73_9BACT|nr:hypothetical protein [Prosthecobacter fusiformis]TDU81313.1 hypothetical protein EI77_00617 [Prosthecobacter fusiformis]